jgi:hypothetical protein
MSDRRNRARQLRQELAEKAYTAPHPEHLANGDEVDHPYVASYSKGLPHNKYGEVELLAYGSLLRALTTGEPDHFERIPLGVPGGTPLVNPQAGLSFDPQGPDAAALTLPPAPRFDSARQAAEAVELYWMALCRDVPFSAFDKNRLVAEAAAELGRLPSYAGPIDNGVVTPGVLFRGDTAGDLRGPYLSQFLLQDIPYGTLRIDQRNDTVKTELDYLTDERDWLKVQNGERRMLPPDGRNHKDRRYLHSPRGLAHYVHYDALYEAYLNACLILLGARAPLDPGNPYQYMANQVGFGTYGGPHVLALVTEVSTRALKAVWHQKWFVHRRMRPEEFGGRVHQHKSGQREYPIHGDVLDSAAVKLMEEANDSYLLPQAFPEGSPMHPSYGAGHAAVAGACVTVLKAWFDESFVLPNAVVSDATGRKLVEYDGPDADRLTVGGELNKLAANIAIGRSMGGVHWRTDYDRSVRLGEQIALTVMREQFALTNERAGLSLVTFDGHRVTV